MKKRYPTLVLTFFALVSLVAQDFQGVATYQSKTSIDFNFEGRNIPEARRQEIMENMKRAMESTFLLTFDRTASLYEQEAALETPGGVASGGFRMSFGRMGDGLYYKNVQQQGYRNQTEVFGKLFLIRDSLQNWQWKLGSETKKIGNYTCYRATAIREVDTARINRMRRRFGPPEPEPGAARDSVAKDSARGNSLLARLDTPKDQEIVAWFTPEIPVSQGPGPYWGLPGLILEVNDGTTVLLCSKIVLNPEEKVRLDPPTKGKEVTQQEYEDIMEEKMLEMSERFRSRGGREGGIQIRIEN